MRKLIFILVGTLFFACQASAQFQTVTALNPLPITSDTKDKPQSKIWYNAGKFWAVLVNDDGTNVYRLDGTSWTSVLQLSTSSYGRADCKMAGNVTHILMYKGTSSELYSVEYVANNNTYKLWSVRPGKVRITLDNEVETASIDMDGTGRLWLASDAVTDINVRYSDSPYTSWSIPITLASGVSTDDICGVIALPQAGKIGVMWSNQITERFGFRTHDDNASPGTWSADEVPASQSAKNAGYGMADDHMNMVVASDGTLYCAAKTSYDKRNFPHLILLVRQPSGSWNNLYEVSQSGTRARILLNETAGKIKVIYSASEQGGEILYKETSIANIAFGPEFTLISGTNNFVTGMKQSYDAGVVVLATQSSGNAVGILGSDTPGTPPPPPPPPLLPPGAPTLTTPTDLATNVAVSPTLSWNTEPDATLYRVQVSATSGFNSVVFDASNITATSASVTGLQHNTTYYWRVNASNTAGTSNWSSVWSFTTAAVTTTSTLAAQWKMDDGQGLTLLDASGNNNHATASRTTYWEPGIDGLALLYNGTSQFAVAPDHNSLDLTNAITLSAWVKPAKMTTQYIIIKAANDLTDGYELTLTSSNLVKFRINQATGGDDYEVESSSLYPYDGNTWMHIAGTFNGTEMRIFVNGVQEAVKTFSSGITITSNNLNVGLGAQTDGTKRLKGSLDEVRIYNTALSTTDISAMATLPQARTSSPGSTNEMELQATLQAYPNPFTTSVTVYFALPAGGDYSLSLVNLTSSTEKPILKGTAKAGETIETHLEGRFMNWGPNMLRLKTKDGIKTLKILHE